MTQQGDEMTDDNVTTVSLNDGGYDGLRIDHDTATGALSVNGRIVGEIEGTTIVLNAAWCRLAGVGLRVDGDPSADKKRTVFNRPVNDHRLASGA